MTKLRSLPYAVLTFSLLAAGGASAQSMSSIDAREAQQQQRIANGVRDGSLTRGETYRLEQGERRIDQYEARARADGHVSGYERQRLDGMLDRESREIHQQRTDGQRAGWNGNEGRGGGWDRGGRDGWDRNGQQHGWNSADGRGGWQNGEHQPGGWNQGGWNQGNANHGGNPGGWNQGGWNGHAPGTPSTPTTPTSGQPGGWSHNGGQGGGGQAGGGQAGGTPGGWTGHAPGTTPTAPTGTAPAGGNAGWQGGSHAQPQYQAQAAQARAMPVAATTQAQPRAAYNGGGNGGGRRH